MLLGASNTVGSQAVQQGRVVLQLRGGCPIPVTGRWFPIISQMAAILSRACTCMDHLTWVVENDLERLGGAPQLRKQNREFQRVKIGTWVNLNESASVWC